MRGAAALALAAGLWAQPAAAERPFGPGELSQIGRAMAIVEAARWRCPLLDPYQEAEFDLAVRDVGLVVADSERERILALGCNHPQVVAAGAQVTAHSEAVLFVHLSAGLALHDAGDERVMTEDRVAWLGEMRAERERLAGVIEAGAGHGRLLELQGRAERLAATARRTDTEAGKQAHTALWSTIIDWTAPLIRRGQHPYFRRAHRDGHWIGFRPDGAPADIAVSSGLMRLSSEGYLPGARNAWLTDAIFVAVHLAGADDCPRCEDRPLALSVDVGWQPVEDRELEPAAVALRLGARQWRADQARALTPLRDGEILADFPARPVYRFTLGQEIVEAMVAAGDAEALALEITFREEDGGLVSSDDLLEIARGRCERNCLPRLPLTGFSDTLHWATVSSRER